MLFSSAVLWGSFLLGWDLRKEPEQGLGVLPSSPRHLQDLCHQNKCSSRFLTHLAKRGKIQLCWQGFLFPADCGFHSSTLWTLKSPTSQVCVNMLEDWKGKMLLRHNKKTHYRSSLWFRPGLTPIKQEPLRERLASGLAAKPDLSPPTTTPFQQLGSGDLSAEGRRSMGLRRAVWVSPLQPS